MPLPVVGYVQQVEVVVGGTLPRAGYVQPVESSGGGGLVTGSGAAGQVTFWTGAQTVSGSASFIWDNTNLILEQDGGAAAVNIAHRFRVSGDTQNRFQIAYDGTQSWGTGAVAPTLSLSKLSALSYLQITAPDGAGGVGLLVLGNDSAGSGVSVRKNASEAAVGFGWQGSGGAGRWDMDLSTSSNELHLFEDGTINANFVITLVGNLRLEQLAASAIVTLSDVLNKRFGVATATPRRTIDALDTVAAQIRATYTDNAVYGEWQVNSNGYSFFDTTGDRYGFGYSAPGIVSGAVGYATFSVRDRSANAAGKMYALELVGAELNGGSPSSRISFIQSSNAGASLSENCRIEHELQSGAYDGGLLKFYTKTSGGSLTLYHTITNAGSVVLNNAALATNATDGFLYIPTCAGAPNGAPTAFTGRVPMIYDTTNNKFWFYSGGAWKRAQVAAVDAIYA